MNGLASRHRFRLVGYLLVGAAALAGACGGKSATEDDGHDTSGKGGTAGSGGDGAPAGGPDTGGKGGSDIPSTGGGSVGGTSGSGDPGKGGSGDPGKGGSGDPGKGGSGAGPNCGGVICGPLPTTCTEIVQEVGACCPICIETGCERCPDLECEEGTHAETVPGDCCPSCLTDPPDACEMGMQAYEQMREALIEKYGSLGCTNSTECTLVREDNACAASCPIILPTAAASSYTDNLNSAAASCATCDPPLPIPCPAAGAPACVNGKCTMAAPR